MLRRNARALVDHRDRIAPGLPPHRRRLPRLQSNLSALHAVAEGVLHQILEDLNELVAVGADDGRTREAPDMEASTGVSCERFERIAHVIEHVVEVDAAARRNVGIHLEARERESSASIRRVMREACSAMMARKRSRALGSSLAVPCSVSMKPRSEASGVLSS